jgi:hypothetical protein
MVKYAVIFVLLLNAACTAVNEPVIYFSQDAPANVKLAAREVRRYVYLRTGRLLRIAADRPVQSGTADTSFTLAVDPALEVQEYRLKSSGNTLAISGGSDIAVLYGAYAFAEKLGIRFYLHGDVIPDGKIPLVIPQLNESHKPIFNLRGVNPWGWHPQGIDAWSTDDYKVLLTQLARLRMNFIGIHCYPEGHPLAEPTVWHGLTGDFDSTGKVHSSYLSRYFNTLHTPKAENYVPTRTSDFSLGGAMLFDDEAWAPDVFRGHTPLPSGPEACNDVFNRMARQFHDAFTFAGKLGVKTCLGTETPLTIPENVLQRTGDVRAVYEDTFLRIMASHPLDYYWLWTPESWTWTGNKPEQYAGTMTDIRLAIEAARNVNAPFRIATAGWVLGPQHDRSALNNDLPKNIPMSAINRSTGLTEIDSAFARIDGREKWAIPWLESDWYYGLGTIQLHAGRMRRDAADARKYGCTGLMGLHWRTDIISPNVSALAQAAWDQDWNDQSATNKPRSLPMDDFYADWSQANFGMKEAGAIFASIDGGKLPKTVEDGCPAGTLSPDKTPWDSLSSQYAFVNEFGKLRERVSGSGNLNRFDYWLNMFKYCRALAQTRCSMGSKDTEEVLNNWTEAYTSLLATVNTPGGLGMVVNMEVNSGWGPAVAKAVGKPLPKDYKGAPRIIVAPVRSVVGMGEALTLKIIILDKKPVRRVDIKVRPLGGKWQNIPAINVTSSVFKAVLQPASEDFEYQVIAQTAAGTKLIWPATAPEMNQTVIIME